MTRTRIVVLSPPATGIGAPNLNQLVAIRVTNQSSGRATTAASAFRYGVDVEITKNVGAAVRFERNESFLFDASYQGFAALDVHL